MDRKINRLKEHYIVCGYGRIGRVLCNKLRKKPIDLVVIDSSEDLINVMEEDGVLYIPGNASDETILKQSGIEKAKGLVAALATDTDNVFLILTAKQLNPDLFIVARATHESAKSKLFAAGADLVESPYDLGAARMAQRIINPTVTDFLDLAFTHKRKDIQMEEIPVKPESKLADVALMDSGIRQEFNLIIIAIKQANGGMLFNPSFESRITPGETVIAVGEVDSLERLAKVLNPS